mgnify:CR=1 FL=1
MTTNYRNDLVSILEMLSNIEKDLNQKIKSGKKKVQTSKKAEKDW